jgi:hypothetical protein
MWPLPTSPGRVLELHHLGSALNRYRTLDECTY